MLPSELCVSFFLCLFFLFGASTSPPDVKDAVIAKFAKCNWDVLRRLPTKGTKPPDGKTLCDLIFELGVYFCGRTNQFGPPPGFVETKVKLQRGGGGGN